MTNCLNCGKPLVQTEGKREKKYCDNNCKQSFWQKKKPKEEKRKVLTLTEWEEIQKKLDAIKEVKIADLTKPANIVKSIEQPKTNFSINTNEEIKRHKKYKEGDPQENSNAFYLRYGVRTYDEM